MAERLPADVRAANFKQLTRRNWQSLGSRVIAGSSVAAITGGGLVRSATEIHLSAWSAAAILASAGARAGEYAAVNASCIRTRALGSAARRSRAATSAAGHLRISARRRR